MVYIEREQAARMMSEENIKEIESIKRERAKRHPNLYFKNGNPRKSEMLCNNKDNICYGNTCPFYVYGCGKNILFDNFMISAARNYRKEHRET